MAFVLGGGEAYIVGKCERPNALIYLCCTRTVPIPCDSSKSSQCAWCAARYKRRVRELCRRGIVGAGAPGGMLTLTAPGVGRHCRKKGHRRCAGDGPNCDPCPCSVNALDVGEWNATIGKRWNRFEQALRRGEASPKVNGLRNPQVIARMRVYETQRRGALHLHVVLMSQTDAPVVLSERKLRRLAIAHGFGHAVDWSAFRTAAEASSRVAAYVAKYVTKACDERALVPWRAPGDNPHRGRRFRIWVASRAWPCTMRQLRTEARLWASAHVEAPKRRTWGLAEGEPLESLHGSYTTDRSPPRPPAAGTAHGVLA